MANQQLKDFDVGDALGIVREHGLKHELASVQRFMVRYGSFVLTAPMFTYLFSFYF